MIVGEVRTEECLDLLIGFIAAVAVVVSTTAHHVI
jgi:hypothetical protein